MIIVHTYEYKGCIKIPLAPCYPYKSMLVDPEDNILSPWYYPVHPENPICKYLNHIAIVGSKLDT